MGSEVAGVGHRGLGGKGSMRLQALLASLCTSKGAELSRGWGHTVTAGPGWRLRAKMQDGQASDHNRWLDHGPRCSRAWSRAASGQASARQQVVAVPANSVFLSQSVNHSGTLLIPAQPFHLALI